MSKELCNPSGPRLVMPGLPAVPMPAGRPPEASRKPEELVAQAGRGAGLPAAAQEGTSGATPAARLGAGADRVETEARDTKGESRRAEGTGPAVLGETEAGTPDIPVVGRQEEAAKERLGFPLQLRFRSEHRATGSPAFVGRHRNDS